MGTNVCKAGASPPPTAQSRSNGRYMPILAEGASPDTWTSPRSQSPAPFRHGNGVA